MIFNNIDVLKKENLLVPNYDDLNIIDLVKLLYNYCGMDYKETKSMQSIEKYVLNKKHIVLVLADGMGVSLLNKMPEKGLFYKNKKMNLQTVFPTATGCVLTSLMTARYPSSTGIFGWYGYNRELNLNYYTLLTKERKTNEDLAIDLKKIIKYPSVIDNLKRSTSFIQPSNLANSRYSCYFSSPSKRKGYNNYEEMINLIKEDICKNYDTFTYVYIPYVDTLEHHNGPYSEEVYKEVSKIEKSFEKLLPLDDNTSIVVIADHGQTPINKVSFMDLNKYDKYFYAYPSIDAGTSTFFVKSGMEEEFEKEFNNDFSDGLLLFKISTFIKEKMFGKRMTKYSKECLGEYISLCKKGYLFYSDYHESNVSIKGNHTGLTSEELMIPLIVLNK